MREQGQSAERTRKSRRRSEALLLDETGEPIVRRGARAERLIRTAEGPRAIARRAKRALSAPDAGVTPRVRAGDQLMEGALHDLRNTMAIALSSLQMLQKEVATSRGRELLREAVSATRLGDKLASRIWASSARADPRVLHIGALLDSTLPLLRRAAGDDIRITTAIDEAVVPVKVDPEGLKSALLNIVLNARDAMPDGGVIEVEAKPAGGVTHSTFGGQTPEEAAEMVISVRDHGSGMSAEARRRAVEPFFTTKGRGAGRGFGLAQVYDFTRQNGGFLEIDSQPGKGTTVRLYLRAAESGRDG